MCVKTSEPKDEQLCIAVHTINNMCDANPLDSSSSIVQINQHHLILQQVKQAEWGNAEEWMGILWLSAIECNYKELNRQLKEQFIHGLNDTDDLGEIIRELTKIQK